MTATSSTAREIPITFTEWFNMPGVKDEDAGFPADAEVELVEDVLDASALITDEWLATDIPAHVSDMGLWSEWMDEIQAVAREQVPSLRLTYTPDGLIEMHQLDQDEEFQSIDWDNVLERCPATDIVARHDI